MPSFLNLVRFFSRFGFLSDENKLVRNYFAGYGTPLGGAASMSETVCNGFEPQTYLKDRCKHCFRVRSKHEDPVAAATTVLSVPSTAATSPTTSTAPKKERRKSWRERVQNPDEGPEQEDATDAASVASFKSANSKGLSSAKSLESVTSASNFDTRSMVTAVSGSIEYDDRALTPTSTEPDDVKSLKLEIVRLQDQISNLKEERQRWTLRKEKKETEGEESLVEMLEEKLLEAENLIQDYRDENTVLKCELRELQESTQPVSGEGDTPILEKLRATEQLCDEMLAENEALKAETRDLQQEIEEMQDQYREEEIEEFRELQRELEQNAKNCRILQFKLRKSERLREEAEAERVAAEERLRSIVQLKGDGESLTTSQMDTARLKELESELRIAKEVSVRLHVELESTEEKRCKLEDEVFFLNEKVRELQTHRKWREARADREKRLSAELPVTVVPIITESTPKEVRDLLERENDLKEQLKYAEEDLKRTRASLHDLENENEELLHKLANLTVSGKLGGRQRPPMTRSASEGNTHLQLELATSEVEHLTAQVSKLEQKNSNLTKKLLDIEIDQRKGYEGKMNGHAGGDLEKEVGRLVAKVGDLERKNAELQGQQKPRPEANEQPRTKALEMEVAELKQLLGKTDNQKLIAMATKAELLGNQLMIANDRINALHKRAVRESKTDGSYAESLKTRCDALEKQLCETRASAAFAPRDALVAPSEDNALASVAEIEQCCVVLASVETQTSRICKQIEKMDAAQKDERRRSLTKDGAATIIAELANVMGELKSVHSLLEAHKLNNPSYVRRSPDKDELAKCRLCEEKEAFIDSQREDIIFYKKKNKELTNQLLQTEDRWSVEMERQRQTYEAEIKGLQGRVADALCQLKEQEHLLEMKAASLSEKTKTIQEKEQKCERLANDVKEKQRIIQDIEKEQKNLKEFETRYRKLESMYSQEKEKFNSDRAKTKSEMALMKKRCDETHQDLHKLRDAHQRREILWNSEREKLEKEIDGLRGQLGKDGKDKSSSISVPSVSYSYKRVTNDSNSAADQQNTITTLRQQVAALEEKMGELRLANEELTSELQATKQNWDRDKENMQHKLRQDEKIRSVEFEALQEKFASRMNIMENTNKSLHSQLVQTRRERDHHKEAVNGYEKRMEEERKRMELEEKHYANLITKSSTMEKRLKDFEGEIDRLKKELKLTKEAHCADKKLWMIEKTHINSKSENSTISAFEDDKDARITENALKAAESVQKQYAEYQRFYDREVDRLKAKIKELTNDAFTRDFEHERTVKQLREQIKVLEIDQRNLIQAKDMQSTAREASQAEQERLQQAVQLAEVQKLTRRYKVSAAIEQLKALVDGMEGDIDGTIRGVMDQLGSVRDDDSQTLYSPTDTSGIYDLEQPSDTVSQSSMSIKSSPFPVNSTSSRWTNHSNTITPNRSFSIESNATWEPRSHSPVKKLTAYPDPPPNFILNKDKTVEYDKDGRLHYVPKSIARSASYDRYGLENGGGLAPPPPKAILTDDEEGPVTMVHSRTSSTGTNILYKIRREELAKGGQPSVRQMAKAFDMMETKPSKRGLFSIRKSRSVETTETARHVRESSKNVLVPGAPSSVLHRNTTSMSQIEERVLPTSSSSAAYTTLPRGGRNPFKNMGTKIVERVRRSLSRTSVNRRSDDESLHETNSVLPTNPANPAPPREAVPATPVRTKTKTKKTTVRKQPPPPTSPPPSAPPDRKLKSTVISRA
ncbi:hypothetical protein QR680_017728 [Steinernema hermaphroditum]|uniref:Uncharacterized protein n=1 Tax=Steinernema hermaphroditum TaxID=289476 RepID=A0AA39HGT8_9BILA|nr:hypothetical protein QR680_017728 [Steinernema hermaphroditum]